MIKEIEVTAEMNGYDLAVVFRTFSKNDGGQSDEISEPIYYIDGSDVTGKVGNYPSKLGVMLDIMYEKHDEFDYTETEIKP